VNVAYLDVYVVENIAVVKCGSSSKFTCLVSIFLIIIYNIGKGKLKIDRRLEHKRRREKQLIECEVSGYKFQSRW